MYQYTLLILIWFAGLKESFSIYRIMINVFWFGVSWLGVLSFGYIHLSLTKFRQYVLFLHIPLLEEREIEGSGLNLKQIKTLCYYKAVFVKIKSPPY